MIKNYLFYCLLLFSALFVGCKDDNFDNAPLEEGQGEITFRFFEHTVYTIDDITDVARLKVTIKKENGNEKEGENIVLPTVDVKADGEEMVSDVLRLDVGNYTVIRYVAYDNKGDQLHDMYLPDSSDNTFSITHDQATAFYFPVNILEVQSADMLKNKLFGLCTEIFGPDSTLWPKTWREENEDITKWENLEYDEDGLYLAGIVFDEKFKGMKKLPANISRFTTLENIMIRDIPEFEELPEELNESNLQSIEIINTSLKSLPENLYIKHLYKISIIDSKLTEFPTCLSNHENLEMLDLVGNEISQIPEDAFTKWSKMSQLRIQHTNISSLPANTFTALYRVYTFDFRWNKNLSSLPTEVPQEHTKFQGLLLDGCAFTEIPEAVGKILELRTLSMADNKLTSIDFNKLKINVNQNLDQLFFDGNKLTSFEAPTDKNTSIILLSLNNCGLNAIPDLSKWENLRYFSAANNNIMTVSDDAFKSNTLLSVIDLSGNTSLTTEAKNFGVYTEKKNQKYDYKEGQTEELDVPVNLKSLNLDGCTSLTWKVPSSWCCLEGEWMFGGNGDKKLPRYPVIVYNRNAPNVTYEKCWNVGYCDKHPEEDCPFRNHEKAESKDNKEGKPFNLIFALEFDEIVAGLPK